MGISHSTHPKHEENWAEESLCFYIPNFADRMDLPGEYYQTRPILAHDHFWSLRVYPRGHDMASSNQLSVYLRLDSSIHDTFTAKAVPPKISPNVDPCVKAKFTVSISTCVRHGEAIFSETQEGMRSWGWMEFASRSSVEEETCDVTGALCLRVDLMVAREGTKLEWRSFPFCFPDAISQQNGSF